MNKTVYSPDLAWGPRLGATFDLTGKGTSVLRGSWGRYFEGAAFNPYSNAVGGWTPFQSYEVLSDGSLELFDETMIGGNWTVDPKVKHYSLDETTLGFEQQLRRDLRFAVTGVWRTWNDFVGAVVRGSTWTPFTRNLPDPSNPTTTKPYTLYRWANRTDTPDTVVTNFKGFQFKDPAGNLLGVPNPSREYQGVMFVLTKTMSNRWNGQFSYVWSESKGSLSNASTAFGAGPANAFRNPNIALVNSDGYMEEDRTHEFKLMGGYTIPKIEVALNAYYLAISGRNYTPYASVSGSSSVLNWTGSLNVFSSRGGASGTRRCIRSTSVSRRTSRSTCTGSTCSSTSRTSSTTTP